MSFTFSPSLFTLLKQTAKSFKEYVSNCIERSEKIRFYFYHIIDMNEALFRGDIGFYLSFYLRCRERLTNGPLKEKVGTFFSPRKLLFYITQWNFTFWQTERVDTFYLHCCFFFEIQELNLILLIFSVGCRRYVTELIISLITIACVFILFDYSFILFWTLGVYF